MFEVRVAEKCDRLPIQHMLELYMHDLSEFWDMELDCHGLFGCRIDKYWIDSKCNQKGGAAELDRSNSDYPEKELAALATNQGIKRPDFTPSGRRPGYCAGRAPLLVWSGRRMSGRFRQKFSDVVISECPGWHLHA